MKVVTRLRTVPVRGARRAASLAAYAAWPIDRWLLRAVSADTPISPAPIFIVGAPRSGSTLLYQLMANQFAVAYVSNLSAYFYHSLVIGLRLHRVLFGDEPFNRFESTYGRTPGLRAPAECGRFWRRWFPRGRDFVAEGELPTTHFTDLRRTFAEAARSSGLPLLIKNLNCGQRLQVLRQVLPEALMVFCRRDPVAVAASILNGRLAANGSKNSWWSVRPPDADALAVLPYWRQVVRQVHSIEVQIASDLSHWPAERWTTVRYETLCSDPAGEIARLRSFLARGGAEVRDRPAARLPELRVSMPHTPDSQDLERIRAFVGELEWS